MDKEESPAESNDSDSEEAAVDKERALAEKEKVSIAREVLRKKSKEDKGKMILLLKCFIFRVICFSKKGSMTMPLNVTPEGWAWLLITLCFPPIEQLPSSDSKSKAEMIWLLYLLC